jgi:hypothetical protein
METRQVLFVLASATQALKGEAALRAAGVQAKLIPLPRSLTAQCGVCLRIPAGDRRAAEAVLAESGTAISATHEIDGAQAKAAAQEGSEGE